MIFKSSRKYFYQPALPGKAQSDGMVVSRNTGMHMWQNIKDTLREV